EIEKNLVLPALALQPLEQHDGRVVVRAGMAYEDARFSAVQPRRSPTGRAALAALPPRILPGIRLGIRTVASAALSGRARDFSAKAVSAAVGLFRTIDRLRRRRRDDRLDNQSKAHNQRNGQQQFPHRSPPG